MSKYQTQRDLTDDEMGQLRESIQANGVLTPLAFDEDGNILDGHHRLAIIRELQGEAEGHSRQGVPSRQDAVRETLPTRGLSRATPPRALKSHRRRKRSGDH
jgi:hypothetical protein